MWITFNKYTYASVHSRQSVGDGDGVGQAQAQ